MVRSTKKKNIHEYDRLMGHINAGLIKNATTIKNLHQRMGHLKELTSLYVHGTKHEIYKDKTEEENTDKEKQKSINRKLRQRRPARVHNTLIMSQPKANTEVHTYLKIKLILIFK